VENGLDGPNRLLRIPIGPRTSEIDFTKFCRDSTALLGWSPLHLSETFFGRIAAWSRSVTNS
jgi:hypothetical protein